jgi:hypothetical protein
MALFGTIYHLTLVGELLGNRTQNGFYFTDKPTSLQTETNQSLVKLMNDFNEWVAPSWALFSSSAWHGLGLIGQVLNVAPYWMIEAGYESLSGGQDAECLPASLAALISLDCGVSGRSHRGRVYVPGIAKNSATGDYLNSGALAQLRVAADGLAGRFALAGTSLDHVYCVYSRLLGDVRNPGPPVSITHNTTGLSVVENLHPRALICSMRRRRPDHGI